MRTSYNIAGTNSGRLSSSLSEFGTGTNLQNIEESLRSIFIADKGYKLAYLDAEQGESRCVGAVEWALFRDGGYLDACESGDLHTKVAKLVWPNLRWTGNGRSDRRLAEQPYYRDHSRRDMCKKLGHGSNYGGKPATLASQAKIERPLVEDFQREYFRIFPSHLRWHDNVRQRLYQDGYIINLTGRKRWFFGRRSDDSTLRDALAYDPQGSLADIVNRGMLAVWRARSCQILMQIHDAILIQYPERDEDRVLELVREQLRFPLHLANSRVFEIPYGIATGWNWGKYSEKNPDGLKSYRSGDERRRTPPLSILDRKFSRVHRQLGGG
jgi:DNA polymerase-1